MFDRVGGIGCVCKFPLASSRQLRKAVRTMLLGMGSRKTRKLTDSSFRCKRSLTNFSLGV